MKRSIICLVTLTVLLALPLAAFAEIKLTVAEVHPEDYPATQGLFKFAELVKEKSAGEIVVDVKFGGVLGKDEAEVVEQVRTGALDMACISIAPMTPFVPALETFSLPYIWKSQNGMWKVLKGEIGARLLKEAEGSQLYGLCYYESGARSFYNSHKAIRSVADMQGLDIRVELDQLMIDLVGILGANPTPMVFGEVYDALSIDIVDGAENTWPVYESTGHYEIAKYYTLDMHTRIPAILVASKIAFDQKLAPEQIQLVMDAAKETQDYVIQKWNERVEASQKIVMESGNIITELNPEAFNGFVDAVRPLYNKYGANHSALIEEIRTAQ